MRTQPAALILALMACAWALLLPWASHAAAEAGGRPDFPWAVVYVIGHLVCHQRPERSFMWADAPWPVCARCAGIYAGAALGALAGAVSGRGWRPWPPARVRLAIGLALLPAGLSLGYEWSTGAMPSHTVRATTGWLAGVVVGVLLSAFLQEPTANALAAQGRGRHEVN